MKSTESEKRRDKEKTRKVIGTKIGSRTVIICLSKLKRVENCSYGILTKFLHRDQIFIEKLSVLLHHAVVTRVVQPRVQKQQPTSLS